MTAGDAEQPTLSGLPAPRRRRPRGPVPLAEEQPVARVVVERGLAHLDRVFEYAVPAAADEAARPGVRVRVRFGGQDVDGVLVERAEVAEHGGELVPLRRVVSPEVVLTPQVRHLVGVVARRYAGTVPDVLRLALPPRHARTEQEQWPEAAAGPDAPAHDAAPWEVYQGGPAFLRRVAGGEAPRAVWHALPGPAGGEWTDAVVQAVRAAREGGRGALVVVPTGAEVQALAPALEAAGVRSWRPGEAGGWVRLVADDGPAVRYRAFLAAVRGLADVVVGTRAAAFAPVHRLGLAVCWDDAHHLHGEPRAPYPHARDVLADRAQAEGAALLVGGLVRSTATTRWVAEGTAHAVGAPRAVVRTRTPRVVALTSTELASEGPAAAARLPGRAWRTVREALARGPVLVQVPRAGYLPVVACARCREPARCPACAGPLGLGGPGDPPQCRWCGRIAGAWRCPECAWGRLRSVRVGSQRTAEELGRAFPGVPVRTSGASTSEGVLRDVPARPALVVATPGAEPRAADGYAAALLLDAAVVTGRTALDVGEQALRTWTVAAALVRPAPDGVVLLVGDGAPAPTQALVRWDPVTFAERELAERAELRLPPAAHVVALEGPRHAVAGLLARLDLPPASEVLGPHVLPDAATAEPGPSQVLLVPEDARPVRALVRSPWSVADTVTAAVRAAQATRAARREPGGVRVQVEPLDIS